MIGKRDKEIARNAAFLRYILSEKFSTFKYKYKEMKIKIKPPIAGSPCIIGDNKTGERKYIDDNPSITILDIFIFRDRFFAKSKYATKEGTKYKQKIDKIYAKRELFNTPNISSGVIIVAL